MEALIVQKIHLRRWYGEDVLPATHPFGRAALSLHPQYAPRELRQVQFDMVQFETACTHEPFDELGQSAARGIQHSEADPLRAADRAGLMVQGGAVRAKRIDLSFPVSFLADGQENRGNCLNISESGLMASFEREADLWATGEIHLSFGDQALVLHARVARCVERDAGIAFMFEDESERAALRMLVESAAMQSTLAGGVAPF